MRRIKCKSSGKDRLKEATRRLRTILKTSRKLSLTPEDLSGLRGVVRLKSACGGGQDPIPWLFFWVLALGVLSSMALLCCAHGGLMDSLTCANNSTKDIQIQTVRLSLDPRTSGPQDTEDTTLFNDSEDAEESHRWRPHLRLRRER